MENNRICFGVNDAAWLAGCQFVPSVDCQLQKESDQFASPILIRTLRNNARRIWAYAAELRYSKICSATEN